MKDKQRAVEVRGLVGKISFYICSTFCHSFGSLFLSAALLLLVLLQLVSKAVLVQISVPFFPVLNYSGTEEGMCSIASVLNFSF